MPGYLYQEQFVPINPYQAPLELYGKALMLKDEKFKLGLQNIRSKYDSILNTPLTNDQNQLKLRAGVQNVMDTLSKVAVSDVSLPENQAQVNSLFDPILNDQDILYDMSWTRHYQNEVNKAEQLQRKSPELVPAQNLEPLYMAQEAYRAGDPAKRPSPVKFSSYYDYNKKMNDELDKVKADIERVFSVATNQVEGPDGKMHNVSTPLQYTVKQLKDYKIQQLLWQRLNTDANALNQMSLDYNYNSRHGFYPPSDAIKGIDQELETYKSVAEGLTQALNLGVSIDNKQLTQNDRDNYTARLGQANSEIARLNQLKSGIKTNPASSNQWFTFNKYIKDYVEGKSKQYSYKEEGLIQDVPGLSELTKYQFDVWKEQWKAIYDEKKERTKKAAQDAEDLANVQAPYNDMVMRLDSSPNGITATNQEIEALGQMTTDNQGRMYMNWSGQNTSIDNTLIYTPASGQMSKEQIRTVDGNIIIGKMKQELEGLGLTRRIENDNFKTETDDFGVTIVTEPQSYDVRKSATELLDEYRSNPNGNSQIKAVVEKYKGVLAQYNINPEDATQLRKLEDALNDPAIEDAVKFGTTVKLNGRFEFVPDQGTNLVKGDNGKLYMKGKFIVPASKVDEAGLDEDDDLVSQWEIVPVYTEDGKKLKKGEQSYGVSVYVPVNGDVTNINDKLLDTQNFQQQWGSKAPQMRAASRNKVVSFQQTLERSRGLSNFELPLREENGNYSLDVNNYYDRFSLPERQRASYNQVDQMATDISMRTGQDINAVRQNIYNILGQNRTPLSRQIAIDNYGYQAMSNAIAGQAPNITADQYLTAIFGNEGGTTGVDPSNVKGSASGKYGLIDSTKKMLYNRYYSNQMTYSDFTKKYNSDANFEYEVARRLAQENLSSSRSLGEALGKWYDPATATSGNWNVVPRPDYGNKLTMQQYIDKAINSLKR